MGIDVLPAQPPRGVSTIQGNFLSPRVRAMVSEYLASAATRTPTLPREVPARKSSSDPSVNDGTDEIVVYDKPSYVDMERGSGSSSVPTGQDGDSGDKKSRLVDVSRDHTVDVLSANDFCR